MYNELAHWKYRSRLQTLKYAWFIRQQTILFTLGYFALHFVSVICPIFPIFLVGNFSCELNEVKEYPANFPPFDFTVLCFMANEKTSIVFVLWTDSKNESGISSPGALLSRIQHFPQFWKKVFFMHKVNTRKVMASNYYLGSIFTSWLNNDQNFTFGVIDHKLR